MFKTVTIQVVLAVSMFGRATPATWSAEPKPDGGPRWEYRVLTKDQVLDLGKKDLASGLNKLGEAGWELVTVEPAFIFKRLKANATPIEDLRRQLLQAKSDLSQWKERVVWAERMVKKGYLTDRQLQAETAQLTAAQLAVDQLEKDIKAFPVEPKPEK